MIRKYPGDVVQLMAGFLSNGKYEPAGEGWVVYDGVGAFVSVGHWCGWCLLSSSKWMWKYGFVVCETVDDDMLRNMIALLRADALAKQLALG